MIRTLFYFIRETFSDAWGIVRSPREGLTSLYQVSLYRNAVYLMASSIALGLTGFFFWIAAARLYSEEEVGLAAAAIAAMSLLSMLAVVGMDHALVRFIPGAGQGTRDVINSSFTIALLTSTVLAAVFIAGLGFWSPKLKLILDQPVLAVVLVLSVVATTLFNLVQRVFAAKRRSSFALAIGLVFGILRFVPLVMMAVYAVTLGIFSAWVVATSISVVIGILLLLPRVEPGFRPSLSVRKNVVSPMVRFASANYLANASSSIVIFVMPLLVLNLLGEQQNAYFYVVWSFSNVMHGILAAVTISLFAEGSYDQQQLREHVKRSLKLMTVILVPVVALTLLLGDKLLLAFGREYSENATHLLWLLILSCVPLSVNLTYVAIMRVRSQLKVIVAMSLLGSAITLGLSPYLLSEMGLVGVGVAYVASQGAVAIYAGRQILKIYSGS